MGQWSSVGLVKSSQLFQNLTYLEVGFSKSVNQVASYASYGASKMLSAVIVAVVVN